MAHILVTGSADGLGRAAAETLLGDGHQVIVHARSAGRLGALEPLISRGASAVIGDLADLDQTRAVADQVNRLGAPDAVIHNAGIMHGPQTLRVNVVAPSLLPVLIERPQRHVYLSSGMHEGGRAGLDDLDWSGQRPTASYSDSKLLLTTLAMAVARLRPDVYSNAVDPGWVPTKMGGPGAPDDLRLGHLTQEWLATSDAPGPRPSGAYWSHKQRPNPPPPTLDPHFQDDLLAALAHFTGAPLT